MKLLFTDLDGTLLTDDKTILDVDMKAIEGMLARGHKLVLCTGRPLTSAKQLAQKYGFDKPGFLLVSFNGGLIYDYATEQSILTRYIPVESVKFIMDAAHKAGMHAHTYSGDLVVSEYETEQLKTYCRLMKMDYVVVKDIRDYYGEFINVVVKPPGKLFDVFSKPEMLEFSHMQSNKGDAVRFMADFYKVPLSDTIAVGDEENDCPMIEAAGVGIAMANASDVAKSVADYVTKADNNHGGIAEIIEKFAN